MEAGPGTTGKRGPQQRALLHTAVWVLAVAIPWAVATGLKWQERARIGAGLDDFRLVWEQLTSALAVLLLIPLVLYWLRRHPLRRERLPSLALAHLAGSALFTAGHLGLMILMRSIVWAAHDMPYYWREGLIRNLLFEYQKDVGIYLVIIVLATILHHYERARQSADRSPPPTLRVQSGTGELTLSLDQIDYLAGARNYVSVFSGEREYLIRETMTALEERLSSHGFVRCHRSYLVRLAAVTELRGGDGGTTLAIGDERQVPLGRSYRASFREAYTGASLS